MNATAITTALAAAMTGQWQHVTASTIAKALFTVGFILFLAVFFYLLHETYGWGFGFSDTGTKWDVYVCAGMGVTGAVLCVTALTVNTVMPPSIGQVRQATGIQTLDCGANPAKAGAHDCTWTDDGLDPHHGTLTTDGTRWKLTETNKGTAE